MFVMTGYIQVEGFKPFKFNQVIVKAGVDNYSNTAIFKIPALAILKCSDGVTYDKVKVDTAQQFKEGLKVEVWAGYDGNNKKRFAGFIRRINYTVPLEIECEGYSYPLRLKKNISRSYPSGTALITVLKDLIQGTGIKLFEGNPSITIEAPVAFRNVSGTQVLDWIKDKLLQTVYFKQDVLYCGLLQTETVKVVKFRLGWNVIKDNDLKFSPIKEFAEVNIRVAARNADGTFKGHKTNRRGDTKYKRLFVKLDDETIQRTAEQERKALVNVGYEGSITAFAEPMVEPGEAANIYDSRYPQRTGTYFIEAVDLEFGPQGGRQKIKIGQTLGTG